MRRFDISGDLAEALPPRAAEKLRKLRELADDLHGVYRSISEKVEPARLAMMKAELYYEEVSRGIPGVNPGVPTINPETGKSEMRNVLKDSGLPTWEKSVGASIGTDLYICC